VTPVQKALELLVGVRAGASERDRHTRAQADGAKYQSKNDQCNHQVILVPTSTFAWTLAYAADTSRQWSQKPRNHRKNYSA
jgi:hypothetical protein